MKKIMYLAGAALLSLAACTDDYKDWAQQEQPTQPVIETTGLTVEAPAALDVATVEGTTVKLFEPTLANTYDEVSYTVSLSNVEGTATVDIPVDAEGNVLVEDLQGAICDLYGRRPVERTVPYTLTALAKKAGNVYKMTSSGTITLTPEGPQISENYYIIGGPNDWAGSAASKALKFKHSEADVYEDPIFTIVFDATEGDTWFAIGDDAACDAITNNNDWSKLLGTTSGNGESGNSGMLNFRYNLSDDGSFKVPAGPKKIKVTLDMMEYSYKVEAVSIAENYYIVGGTLDWAASAASKEQKFSRSDKDLFEDPYFSIIIPANAGGETWFAIGDDEACDAITNNSDWSKLYGNTAGNGANGATGSLARRSELTDDGSFKYVTNAAQIKIVINMLEGTFAISDVAPQYFMVGALPGWSADGAKTALFYPTSASTMTYTTLFEQGNNLKIWNRNDLGNWDNAYGSVNDNSTDASGALVGSGAGAICVPGAGVYTLSLDLGTMTYSWTMLDNQSPAEYETIGVVGGFCNWANNGATDLDMTQVTPHNWYVETEITENTELKFRANDGWDTNWGAELSVAEGNFYATGVGGGANISVPAGTYAFYFNDITGQFAIVKQ